MPKTLPTEYTAVMTGEPYLFFEFRQVAKLRFRGLTEDEIRARVRDENLFQYKTAKSIKRVLRAVIRRLNALDETLILLCNKSSLNTSRFVALFAVAKTNLLFFEFLEEVYREKLLLGDETLTMRDVRVFFAAKRQESAKVAVWSDETVAKLGQVYLRTIQEAGLINSDHQVIPPFLEEGLAKHLRHRGEGRFLSIFAQVV